MTSHPLRTAILSVAVAAALPLTAAPLANAAPRDPDPPPYWCLETPDQGVCGWVILKRSDGKEAYYPIDDPTGKVSIKRYDPDSYYGRIEGDFKEVPSYGGTPIHLDSYIEGSGWHWYSDWLGDTDYYSLPSKLTVGVAPHFDFDLKLDETQYESNSYWKNDFADWTQFISGPINGSEDVGNIYLRWRCTKNTWMEC